MRALMAVACFLSMPALASDPALKSFGWFADFVGACWVGDFPDGKIRHKHCYTSQFGKFMRGTAVLSSERDGKMEEQFSGDSVYSWNAKENRIDYVIWGSDGTLARHEAVYEGDTLTFPVRRASDSSVVAFRSVWRRLEDGSLEVTRERPADGGWKKDFTVKYRREAPAK